MLMFCYHSMIYTALELNNNFGGTPQIPTRQVFCANVFLRVYALFLFQLFKINK